MSNTYLTLLKKHNLSNTRKRQYLFSLLQDLQHPLPTTELVTLAQNFMDRSNVYRSIDDFERAGIVKKVYTGWKESVELSDSFSHHHHHMTCTNCGKVISFEESKELEKELLSIARNFNFTAKYHSIEFGGVCVNCS